MSEEPEKQGKDDEESFLDLDKLDTTMEELRAEKIDAGGTTGSLWIDPHGRGYGVF